MGGDLGEQETAGTPGEGELLRPLDFTNALTTIPPNSSGEIWTNLRMGNVCTPALTPPVESISAIEESRNQLGSLTACLQETSNLWRWQEADAYGEEVRGEIDSGLEGQ